MSLEVFGERRDVTARWAGSYWRFPALAGGLLFLSLLLLYLVRGMRMVRLGALAAIGALGFLASFSHPYPALVFFLFVFFSPVDIHVPGPLARALLLSVSARVVFDWMGGHSLDWGSRTFRVLTVVVVVICITSMLVAQRLGPVVGRLDLVAMGVLVYVCVTRFVDRPSRLNAVVIAIIVGFMSSVLYGVIRLANSGTFQLLASNDARRFFSPGLDANHTAVRACCLIPFVVFAITRARRIHRPIWVVALLALMLAVVGTVSRMGMGILLFIIVALSLKYRRVGVALIAVALSGFVLVPKYYWIRFVSLGQLGGIVVDRSLQLRQHALESTWQMFLDHPWTGVGLGNVMFETPRYMSNEIMPHNSYLEVLASFGIVGFVVYMAWIASGFAMAFRAWQLWRRAQRNEESTFAWALLLSLGVFFMSMLALDLPLHPLLWFLFGLANAVRVQAERGMTFASRLGSSSTGS